MSNFRRRLMNVIKEKSPWKFLLKYISTSARDKFSAGNKPNAKIDKGTAIHIKAEFMLDYRNFPPDAGCHLYFYDWNWGYTKSIAYGSAKRPEDDVSITPIDIYCITNNDCRGNTLSFDDQSQTSADGSIDIYIKDYTMYKCDTPILCNVSGEGIVVGRNTLSLSDFPKQEKLLIEFDYDVTIINKPCVFVIENAWLSAGYQPVATIKSSGSGHVSALINTKQDLSGVQCRLRFSVLDNSSSNSDAIFSVRNIIVKNVIDGELIDSI